MSVITIPRQVAYPVRQRRRQLGLTQAQLAEKAGVSRQLVLSLEAGRATGIALDKLMGVLDALGLTLSVDGGRPEDAPHPSEKQHRQAERHRYQDAFQRNAAHCQANPALFQGLDILPRDAQLPGAPE